MDKDRRTAWQEIDADPDPETDLGYELDEWDVVEARSRGQDHLMFLPSDEEQLRDDAFIVADPAIVYDVVKFC